MEALRSVAGSLRVMLRLGIIYEFVRSALVGGAHKAGVLNPGLALILDLVSVAILGMLTDDDRRSWALIWLTVVLVELARMGLTSGMPGIHLSLIR